MTDKPIQFTPEMEALVLAELKRRVERRRALTKAIIGVTVGDGDRHTYRSPVDDRKLGMIYRTDPDPEWRITDRAALDAWLDDHPEYHHTTVAIRAGCEAEAFAVLADHEPHLLDEVTDIHPDAPEQLLAASRDAGAPAAPGIEWVKPPGVLTVSPDKGAGDVIEAMVAAGVITWDGRPALPAGEDPDMDQPVDLASRRDTTHGGDAA